MTPKALKALSDRAGTIARRAKKLSEDLAAAGRVKEAITMADLYRKAVEVDGRLYQASRS